MICLTLGEEARMRIDDVQLSVPDPAAALAFYGIVLQLPAETEGDRVAVRASRTRLCFSAALPREHPRYHIAFSIPLARFDAARRLVAAHAPLITADGDEVMTLCVGAKRYRPRELGRRGLLLPRPGRQHPGVHRAPRRAMGR
jgi:catechol 2,3-dioxygenase-like lactoylglutathione lyase family enzyme